MNVIICRVMNATMSLLLLHRNMNWKHIWINMSIVEFKKFEKHSYEFK